MQLPHVDRARVAEAKITHYLLAESHPEGGGKAVFFQRYGFTRDDWQRLAKALLQHARQFDVVRSEDTQFGTRHIIEGTIETPSGAKPFIRSVWFSQDEGAIPRFVTAYPIKQQR